MSRITIDIFYVMQCNTNTNPMKRGREEADFDGGNCAEVCSAMHLAPSVFFRNFDEERKVQAAELNPGMKCESNLLEPANPRKN